MILNTNAIIILIHHENFLNISYETISEKTIFQKLSHRVCLSRSKLARSTFIANKMTSFNAIVWDAKPSPGRMDGSCPSKSHTTTLFVVGRVFLPNLTQVPPTWRVQFRHKVLPKDSKLEDMLWCDMQPLHIFKPRASAILGKEGQITLKYLSGRTLQVTICAATTVAELGAWVARDGQQYPMCLALCGKGLEVEERVMDKVPIGSVVHASRCVMPTAACRFVNMDGDHQAGRLQRNALPGTRPGQLQSWKAFHVDNMGLTMYGNCPVATCDSHIHENCADRVVVQAKYGVVRLTPGMDKFPCPLCHTSNDRESTLGMFSPANFNVMFGRSLFRFKKCGVNEPVKAVLMESLSATGEYTTFDSSSEPCNYDVIEILTVGPNSSPFYCVKCDCPCSKGPIFEYLVISEVLLSCGHAYHSRCLPKDKSCIACASKLFENLCELVTEDDNVSTLQTTQNGDHGHDLFSDVFPSLGDTHSILDTAYLKISAALFQENYREFRITQRQEQAAVDSEVE